MTNFSKRFRGREDGSLSIEAVLVIPILVWAIIATLVFFDAFKTLNVSQKATYTVADMLSREAEVDQDMMTTMHEVFDFLAHSPGDNALRVTVVSMSEDPDSGVKTLNLVWSEGVGGIEGYENLTYVKDRVPDMAAGEQLIFVETEQEWSPVFAVGLAKYRFREVAVMRPRFAPQLKWNDGSIAAGA